jgi:uncharacterized protein YggT (Ycf19 family)
MGLIDFILNLAALLLWLAWRSLRFDPLVKTSAASLSGTLRRTEPARFKRWRLPTALALLLLGRAVLYWQIAPAVNWTAKLDLVVVALAFRCDVFGAAALYSLLAFGRVLLIFYVWLVVLVIINHRTPDSDPTQRMLRLHLGRLANWPRPIQLLVPLLSVAGLWLAFHPLLAQAGITNRSRSYAHLLEQGLLIGGGFYLSLKYLLPALLLLNLVASYVYLGSSPFWDFVATTAQNLLAPFRRLPLRFAKFDFAPLVVAALILLLLHALPNFILHELSKQHLTLWPQ